MSTLEILALIFVICVGLELVRRMRRKEIDTERLDALQKGQWIIGMVRGEFAVLAGDPPEMLSGSHADLRAAIDEAIREDARRAEEEMGVHRGN